MESSSSGDSGEQEGRGRASGEVAPVLDSGVGVSSSNPSPNLAPTADGRQDPSQPSTSGPALRPVPQSSIPQSSIPQSSIPQSSTHSVGLLRVSFLEKRIELLEDHNLRLLDEDVAARNELDRHPQSQHTLANGSQNPQEARTVTTNDRLLYELKLAHQRIARLEKEAEKGVSEEVQEANQLVLLHEKKLENEEIARLRNEMRRMEEAFREQNAGLNRKLNTAKAENEGLKKKVEDAEAMVEELVQKKSYELAELKSDNESKNREIGMLKEENEHLKTSVGRKAELEADRLQLHRGQAQLEAERKALADQRRQLEDEKKQTSMIAKQQSSEEQAKLDAARLQLQERQAQLVADQQALRAQQRQMEENRQQWPNNLAAQVNRLEKERQKLTEEQRNFRTEQDSFDAMTRQFENERSEFEKQKLQHDFAQEDLEERESMVKCQEEHLKKQMKQLESDHQSIHLKNLRELEKSRKSIIAKQAELDKKTVEQNELLRDCDGYLGEIMSKNEQLEQREQTQTRREEQLAEDRTKYNGFLHRMLAENKKLQEKKQKLAEISQQIARSLESQRNEKMQINKAGSELVLDTKDYHAKIRELSDEQTKIATEQQKIKEDREKLDEEKEELEIRRENFNRRLEYAETQELERENEVLRARIPSDQSEIINDLKAELDTERENRRILYLDRESLHQEVQDLRSHVSQQSNPNREEIEELKRELREQKEARESEVNQLAERYEGLTAAYVKLQNENARLRAAVSDTPRIPDEHPEIIDDHMVGPARVDNELLEAKKEIEKLKKQLKEQEDAREIKVDGLAEQVRRVADAYLELKNDKRILARHFPRSDASVGNMKDLKKKLDWVVAGVETLTDPFSRLQNANHPLAQGFLLQDEKKQLKEKEDAREIKVDGLVEQDERVGDLEKKVARVVLGVKQLTKSYSKQQNENHLPAQGVMLKDVVAANIDDEEIAQQIEQEPIPEDFGAQEEELVEPRAKKRKIAREEDGENSE